MWLIIVTGRPAAGKSTLAAWLGKELSLPVIGKDGLKEVLFRELGWRDREWSKALGRASVELLYHLAEVQLAAGKSVIVENAFHAELASPSLRTLVDRYEVNALQIICRCDPDVLFERFKRRAEAGERHPGHVDGQVLDELRANLAEDRPLRLHMSGHVLEIDMTDLAVVNYEDLLRHVREAMENAR